MKKFVIFIVVLLVLLVGAVALLPQLIPLEKIKPEIQAQIKKQIGRDLLIEGPIKISVWPNLSVNLQKVSLSNASWGRAKTFITLDEVDAELKLMPLLRKRIEIDRFVLHAPRINLEVNKNGKGNWEFETASSTKEVNNDKKPSDSKASISQGLAIKFGEFKITDGVVNYEEFASNTKYALDKIDITINAKDMNSPVKINGKAQYRARMMNIDFFADNLGAVSSMSAFKGGVTLNIEPFAKFSLLGDFLKTPNDYMTAEVKTDILDINALMNWVSPTGVEAIPFKTLKLSSSKIVIGKKKDASLLVSIPNLQMTLDDMNMSGLLELSTRNNNVPYIKAGLSLPEVLDIPALLNKLSTSNDNIKTPPKKSAETSPTSGWSDEKIDLSVLHTIDGDFTFTHNGLIYKDVKTGAGKAIVKLLNGALSFNLPETSVDKGSILSKLSLKESGKNTQIQFSMDAKNMPIKTLLKSFADIDMMSGTGDISFSMNSKGQSQKALIQTMSGKADINLSDGTIEGIDFVDIAQMLQKRLATVGLGDKGTKFADFNASFTIDKGVALNEDMKLVGPLVEATGSGKINLAKQSMNYRVIPKVILKKGTSKVQGKSITNTTGLSVPVDITGMWSNLKIQPDYKALLNDVLKDPKQFEEMGKNIVKDVEGQIKNLKNLKENPDEFLQDIDKTKDMLEGLLGR